MMENRAVRLRGFSIILLVAFLTIATGWLKAVYAADIEAVLDDAAGASVFSVKDSSSVEGAHIDSDGNMVIKGGLRLDASGAEHTTAENLIVDGSVGIGDTSPASALTVGLGDLFQVDTSGDIIKLKNITYAWPSSQAAGSSYVLTNNGAGTLSWTAPGGISASSALSAITAAIAANTIANANFAQAWNWDTLTTETAMALGSTSITSGKLLSLSSSATGFTGTMQDITLSGNNAANTGTLFKSTVSGAASAAVPLMITNAGTGLSLRVNDDGTDTDTTPVVVDASGNVGIGTTAPEDTLHVYGIAKITRAGAGGTIRIFPSGENVAYQATGTGDLMFQTNGNSTKMTVSNAGNVGIGTTGPNSPFHVKQSANTLNGGLILERSGGTAKVGIAMASDPSMMFGLDNDGDGILETEWMRIDEVAGNVGIGTVSPGAKLDIVTAEAYGQVKIESTAAGSGGAGIILYQNSASPAADDITGRIEFDGKRSDGNQYWMSMIESKWTDPAVAVGTSRLVFSTRSGETTNTAMTIDHSGNVGIGQTAPATPLSLAQDTGILSWGNNDGSTQRASILGTSANTLTFSILGSQKMVLTTDGNVGIGTTGPTGKLTVSGGTNAQLLWLIGRTSDGASDFQMMSADSATTYAILSATSTGLDIGAGSTAPDVTILNSGNVGIGTTSPNSKLEVTGGIGVNRAVAVATGNIDISGSYLTNGADYAEYFEAEGELLPGDIAGISIAAGKARKYIPGDTFIGIVAKTPGIIGNNKDNKEGYALIGLLGQMEFKQDQVVIEDRVVQTKDGKKVGILLSNGKVLIGN